MPEAIVVELFKLGLGAYFTMQRNKGKTDDEITKELITLQREVLELDPYNLPDPVHDPSKD
jgi:hypothetical protein